jgi:hypothetical protein
VTVSLCVCLCNVSCTHGGGASGGPGYGGPFTYNPPPTTVYHYYNVPTYKAPRVGHPIFHTPTPVYHPVAPVYHSVAPSHFRMR